MKNLQPLQLMILALFNMSLKPLLNKILILALLCGASFSQAAGVVDFVSGNVVVNNANNQMRTPKVGDSIEEGDTILTAANAEIHIITDDKGLIAVRQKTQLKFDTYQAQGNAKDTIVLTLLRGTFRSVTGWVGKLHPQRYQVRTATATIGIRGTDHEPLVIENGSDAGTYDKVNSGATMLDSAFGKIDVSAKQIGFVPKSAKTPPMLIDSAPKDYQLSPNEKRIDEQIAPLQQQQEQHMQATQTQALKQGGGLSAGADVPNAGKIGDFADYQKAVAALEGLFRQYEAGNINAVRNHLDPSMIGLQRLLDGMMAESNTCKQMRIRLYNTQTQASPDLAVIQTNWEKRCLMLPDFTPNVRTGFSTFLMHKEKSIWGMAALSNDNPFFNYGGVAAGLTASNYTLATLSVSSTNTCSAIAGLSSPTAMPISLTLTDPDIKTSTASVVLTNRLGESETVVLTGSGGVFTRTTLVFNRTTPTPNNGVVEMNPSFAALLICPSLTVRYTDNTTPSGAAQTVQNVVTFP